MASKTDSSTPARATRSQSGWRATLRFWLHPCALLLFAQLLEIVLYPAVSTSAVGAAVITVFGIAVLLTALRLVHYTRGFVWHAVLVATVAVVLDVGAVSTGHAALQAAHWAAAGLLYFYVARCLIGYMLADRHATTDELFGAAATFTLLVWAFAQLLLLCQLLQPAAFGASEPSWSELMFLSFALLTNTGIGNTIPATALTRAIADIEMFCAVMYLALVVSRLIGIAVSNQTARR